jgi:hypothetical protein
MKGNNYYDNVWRVQQKNIGNIMGIVATPIDNHSPLRYNKGKIRRERNGKQYRKVD